MDAGELDHAKAEKALERLLQNARKI